MSHPRLWSFLPHVRTGAGGCLLQLEAQGEVRAPSPQGGGCWGTGAQLGLLPDGAWDGQD